MFLQAFIRADFEFDNSKFHKFQQVIIVGYSQKNEMSVAVVLTTEDNLRLVPVFALESSYSDLFKKLP